MRIIFMGTPEFAVPTLTEIVAQGHDVVAAYTRAPRPAGRGMDLTRSPVHAQADLLGIPVRMPKTLRDPEEQAAFAALEAEAAVVVAYGLILPQPVLDAPEYGCLNLHGSLLPRWRGAAPLQRAIMAGDTETGVMVMRMEAGLDTGPVAMTERVRIGPDETARELHDRLAPLGADLMVRALAAASRGSLGSTPQPETGVTYAHKIDKAEARIDWSKPAADIHNLIRGLSPFPGSWCEMPGPKGPERVKIIRSTLAPGAGVPGTLIDDGLAVACGTGAVRLVQLQRAGGKPLAAADFLKGFPLAAGAAVA